MGVLLQGFYWDCPAVDNVEHGWWDFIHEARVDLAQLCGSLFLLLVGPAPTHWMRT